MALTGAFLILGFVVFRTIRKMHGIFSSINFIAVITDWGMYDWENLIKLND